LDVEGVVDGLDGRSKKALTPCEGDDTVVDVEGAKKDADGVEEKTMKVGEIVIEFMEDLDRDGSIVFDVHEDGTHPISVDKRLREIEEEGTKGGDDGFDVIRREICRIDRLIESVFEFVEIIRLGRETHQLKRDVVFLLLAQKEGDYLLEHLWHRYRRLFHL